MCVCHLVRVGYTFRGDYRPANRTPLDDGSYRIIAVVVIIVIILICWMACVCECMCVLAKHLHTQNRFSCKLVSFSPFRAIFKIKINNIFQINFNNGIKTGQHIIGAKTALARASSSGRSNNKTTLKASMIFDFPLFFLLIEWKLLFWRFFPISFHCRVFDMEMISYLWQGDQVVFVVVIICFSQDLPFFPFYRQGVVGGFR